MTFATHRLLPPSDICRLVTFAVPCQVISATLLRAEELEVGMGRDGQVGGGGEEDIPFAALSAAWEPFAMGHKAM